MRIIKNTAKNECICCADVVPSGMRHFYCKHDKCIYEGTAEMEEFERINERLEREEREC